MSTPSDTFLDLGPAEDWIRAWRKTLRPGGPEVDPVVIMAYIDKTLSADDAQYVEQLIQTFEEWSAMYWEIRIAVLDMEDARRQETNSTSCPTATEQVTPSSNEEIRTHIGKRFTLRQGTAKRLVSFSLVCALILVGYHLLVVQRFNSSVAKLRDGSQTIEVLANGEIRGLIAIPPTLIPSVRVALTTGKIAPTKPLLWNTGSRSVAIRQPELLEPCFTSVASDQPTFRWQGSRKATSYAVRIFAEDGKVIAKSDSLTRTEWQPSIPLPRGEAITWDVVVKFEDGTSILPDRSLLRPMFRVLTVRETEEYKQMSANLRDSHLAWGIYLVQAGLLDQAVHEFEALEKSNPDSSVIKELVQQVETLRMNPPK